MNLPADLLPVTQMNLVLFVILRTNGTKYLFLNRILTLHPGKERRAYPACGGHLVYDLRRAPRRPSGSEWQQTLAHLPFSSFGHFVTSHALRV